MPSKSRDKLRDSCSSPPTPPRLSHVKYHLNTIANYQHPLHAHCLHVTTMQKEAGLHYRVARTLPHVLAPHRCSTSSSFLNDCTYAAAGAGASALTSTGRAAFPCPAAATAAAEPPSFTSAPAFWIVASAAGAAAAPSFFSHLAGLAHCSSRQGPMSLNWQPPAHSHEPPNCLGRFSAGTCANKSFWYPLPNT